MLDQENSLILHLMMKVFCESVEKKICVPDVEMEENHYGFCSRVTSFKGWIRFHLGDSGQVNQISSFLAN